MHNIMVVKILTHLIFVLLADKTMSAHFVKKLLSVGGEFLSHQPRSIRVLGARKLPANLTDCITCPRIQYPTSAIFAICFRRKRLRIRILRYENITTPAGTFRKSTRRNSCRQTIILANLLEGECMGMPEAY